MKAVGIIASTMKIAMNTAIATIGETANMIGTAIESAMTKAAGTGGTITIVIKERQ